METWKLFGLTQNIGKDPSIFSKEDKYRDYKAFMVALWGIANKNIEIKEVFDNGAPTEFLRKIVIDVLSKRDELLEKVFEAAVISKNSFGAKEAKIYTKVAEGTVEALETINPPKHGFLGITTSAPKGTTEDWIKEYPPTVEDKFSRDLIREGIIDKSNELRIVSLRGGVDWGKLILYIADTRYDISAVEEMIAKSEVPEVYKDLIHLAMVKNGMGVENEWNHYLKKARYVKVGENMTIHDTTLDVIESIVVKN